MLQLSKSLVSRPVLSLRTGGQIGETTEPIMNPNNLKIEGFYCIDRFTNETLILLNQDVRDLIPQGIVVDDHEVLVKSEELIRLKPVLDLRFALIGKAIVTKTKQRLGKVVDFAVDDVTMYVQKIYASQGLIKGLSSGQLSIDRSQIIEITDRKIIVEDPLKPVKEEAPLSVATPAT